LIVVDATDLTLDHANALLTLSYVLVARGLEDDTAVARADASTLLRAKGALARLARLGG